MKKKLFLIISLVVISVVMLSSCLKEKETYIVTFDLDGGTMYTQQREVVFDDDYVLPTPIKAGFQFSGWYYNDQKIENYGKNWLIREDVMLVAKWEYAQYEIKYELNGGVSYENPTKYDVQTETFSIYPPTKEGCIFSHWLDDKGNKYDDVITIQKGTSGNLKFTAVWWNFVGENGLTYSYENGELTVTGYKGKLIDNFAIPSHCYGKPVVAIGEGAFEGLGGKITDSSQFFRIDIPTTITRIEKNAFNDCFGVKILLVPAENDNILSSTYMEMVEEWASIVAVESGNSHVIDVIKIKRPAIGWSPYSQN